MASDVVVFSQSNNTKKLSEALERANRLNLHDDDGLFKYAEMVQQVLLVRRYQRFCSTVLVFPPRKSRREISREI